MSFPYSIYINNKNYSIPNEYPFGYNLYMVKHWNDPYMQSIGYSALLRGNVGQFAVVSPYIFDVNGKWCGALSSNTNYSTMRRADVFKLANHQLLDFGYKWGMSEQEIISMLNVVLPDGFSLKSKMGWLIASSDKWGLVMKSDGDWWDYQKDVSGKYILDSNGNKKEVTVDMIAIFFGGQKVLASDETMVYNGLTMRRLITFRRADFGKHYDNYPYLMQRATVASTPNNVYGEYPKGYVYCPVALDPRDFAFYTSGFTPDSYWLPADQMVLV